MSQGGKVVGSGYRIEISPEYDTQSAEERRDAAFKRNPGLQRMTRPWGDVLTQGWGQIVYQWLKSQGDNVDGTTKYNVFALGDAPDNGKIFEVPNREHYDVGRVHNDALYVQVTVWPDLEDQARQAADQAQREQAAALTLKQQQTIWVGGFGLLANEGERCVRMIEGADVETEITEFHCHSPRDA